MFSKEVRILLTILAGLFARYIFAVVIGCFSYIVSVFMSCQKILLAKRLFQCHFDCLKVHQIWVLWFIHFSHFSHAKSHPAFLLKAQSKKGICNLILPTKISRELSLEDPGHFFSLCSNWFTSEIEISDVSFRKTGYKFNLDSMIWRRMKPVLNYIHWNPKLLRDFIFCNVILCIIV